MQYRSFIAWVPVLSFIISCAGASFEDSGNIGGRAAASGGSGQGTGGRPSGGASATGGKASNAGGNTASGGVAQGTGGRTNSSGGSNGGTPAAGGAISGSGSHAECQTAADCELFDDCCRCASVPKGELSPSCALACIQSSCSAAQVNAGDLACVLGRCVLNRSCDDRAIACDSLAPVCPAGQAAEVGNTCYTGRCLAVTECSAVASCDVCGQVKLRCATLQLGPTHHCVETPPACQNDSSCACMSVCLGAFQCAEPSAPSLMCVCPTC